ncbi:hypothetical protein BU26DRAFT_560810 [Trematosphaeria pertusa]|uniref:Hydrophobin n=1 Tax=Trematosphaeria pertusa TaxID=390896 RepID=A0A6A6ISI3_9PLEO|nr:uncharacterized protein BU26DRAFT_560810 [Trematosphaeria pertusa]KAF2253515.1 hypothetical protein BU26DRAFT_560810 [Trematosphaeria pertusa]
MKTFVAILSLAVLAAASPLEARTAPKSPKEAGKACGSNVVSCCNTSNEQSSSGILSGLFGPILSGGCLGASVSVLSILDPLTDTAGMCGDNTIQCCEGDNQTGLINVSLKCVAL